MSADTLNDVMAALPYPCSECPLSRIELSNAEAIAFADYLKRARWGHYRQLAVNDQEAYNMQNAAGELRNLLAECSFEP